MERLNDGQLEQLCALVYLDGFTEAAEGRRLGEIIDGALAGGLARSARENRLPCAMTETEWRNLLTGAGADERLRGLEIRAIQDVTAEEPDGPLRGHRAAAFADGDGRVYAVFRGTGGDGEWRDNALGMIYADTRQQRAAARFVEEIRKTADAPVIAAGHSKGGNKAQYALFTLPEGTVGYCLSVDGQGFSPAFAEKYKSAIETRKDRVHLRAERRDIVNALGIYAAGVIDFHTGRRGNASEGKPHGDALPYFHCPDALRDERNRVGPAAGTHPLPDAVNMLVTYFLTCPEYENIREETALNLVELMTREKNAGAVKTAKALVNIIVAFMSLLCTDQKFAAAVRAALTAEHDALAATIDAAADGRLEHMKKISEPLKQDVLEILLKRSLTEPRTRRHIENTLKHASSLSDELAAAHGDGHKLSNHIAELAKHLRMILGEGI